MNIRRVCAWCGTCLSCDPDGVGNKCICDKTNRNDEDTTHGCCNKHFLEFKKEMETYKNDKSKFK